MNAVLDYHERSKHRVDRYAPGPGRLDWTMQPEPFRHFAGAPPVDMPLLDGELPARWDDLFVSGAVASQPFELATLAHLLELSLGLATWKSYGGSRWALRCNPSSGNLHPTEGYLICPSLPGLPGGVYHYQPHDHRLERRATADLAISGGVLVVLTGIHWREAWKYGMRAFRYCQHDCGHAMAALSYAAAALGWPARLLTEWGDDEIAAITGVDRAADLGGAEPETAEAILWIGPGTPPTPAAVLRGLEGAAWRGLANTLSKGHRNWPDIPAVAAATHKRPGGVTRHEPPPPLPQLAAASQARVSELVRRRRSAQAFDGVTAIDAASFFRMLDALLPREKLPPWSLLNSAPEIHLAIFVHRVQDLDRGVYCMARDPAMLDVLKSEMRTDWAWAEVSGCPPHLPLRLLAPMDVRAFAAGVSCQQDIAGDSAFAVAMLARFDDLDSEHGWLYRHRFWEAGMLGQVLYLEAEAAGVRGTGIGCYFDDAVHEALGLKGTRFQDVYQFTVGGALPDTRLRTEPPYAHLADRPRIATTTP